MRAYERSNCNRLNKMHMYIGPIYRLALYGTHANKQYANINTT